jgi:hypothetical protein
VEVSEGVVKFAPVPSNVPPEAASYQSYVPPGAVALNVAVPPEQITVPLAVGAAGIALTVILTVTGALTHPWEVVTVSV